MAMGFKTMRNQFAVSSIAFAGFLLALSGCSSSDDDDDSAPGTGGTAAVTGGTTGGGTGGTSTSNAGSGPSGSGGGTTPATGGKGGGSGMSGSGGGVAPMDDAGVPQAGDSVWTMMGYDERNNYFNPNEKTFTVENAANIKELWRFDMAGVPPGSPVVAEGKVFALATGGLYAVNLADGSMAWQNLDIKGYSSAAYADGFIYVHTTPGAQLYKLKAADGAIAWGPVVTYDLANCDGTSSPILADGKVIVGHACGPMEIDIAADLASAHPRGGVHAFNMSDGTEAWHYFTVPETGEDGAMVWSTVSVDIPGGTVFAATGNNYSVQGANSDSIHAIGLADGMMKWKTQVRNTDTWSFAGNITGPDTDFGANPILAEIGGKKIAAAGDKNAEFFAFDRETGQKLWNVPGLTPSRNQANGGVLNNGAFDGTNFYVVSNDPTSGTAMLHALKGTDGTPVWPAKPLPKINWAPVSIANGLLFVPDDEDLLIFNAADGSMLKSFTTGGTIAAGAASVAAGRILVKSGLEYPLDATAKSNKQLICYGL
jgi:outer membrane protein assembly factor BamB